ncbi:Ribosomal RNA-processing protein 7 (RRP7) family protein [Candida albicans]|uniref:Ribosomal RNA-processing protein 7 (RRP7) family protein n=1 Tax=Candida albicans TaxID=5476 RepID=A0A8H6BXJ0_CANAX|nr:Ribosomal RNA-processing protein 7 (RRP7) family protein [Candida albicans]
MAPTEIKGFYVLPLKLTGTKSIHYIYFKKHESKGTANDNRSLFICNLPISTDLSTIKKFFQKVAIGSTIESFINSLLTDYPEDIWINLTKLTSDLDLVDAVDEQASKLPKNCGIVAFIDKASFTLAFNSLKKLSSSLTECEWPIQQFTSNYYLKQYQKQILDPNSLTEEVSQALIDFDKAEQQSIEELQSQRNLVDEDGFTLVKLASTVGVVKAQSKMKSKEKQDFYRFQLRQRKKEEMNELLNKFKLDQEKVRMMKEKKRFRPY